MPRTQRASPAPRQPTRARRLLVATRRRPLVLPHRRTLPARRTAHPGRHLPRLPLRSRLPSLARAPPRPIPPTLSPPRPLAPARVMLSTLRRPPRIRRLPGAVPRAPTRAPPTPRPPRRSRRALVHPMLERLATRRPRQRLGAHLMPWALLVPPTRLRRPRCPMDRWQPTRLGLLRSRLRRAVARSSTRRCRRPARTLRSRRRARAAHRTPRCSPRRRTLPRPARLRSPRP